MKNLAQTAAVKNVLTLAQLDFINHIGAVKMPRFIAINGYQNKEGAVSNYVININHKYGTKVKKDIGQLKAVIKAMPKTPETALEYMAATILLEAFIANGNKETASVQSLVQNELYEKINGSVQRHKETGEYYLHGYLVSRTVIVAVQKKVVSSKPLTVAKDILRRDLRTEKYVRFKFSLENFSVTLQGSTLVLTAN